MSLPANTLLVGARGMLGRAFVELLGDKVLTPTREELNLESPDSISAYLSNQRPARVICCAAYTDVDGAETDEARATLINGNAMGALGFACKNIGAPLLHFGTDYVFSGDATAPYPREAELAPQNAYGRSKAAGEQALVESGADFLQIRTSWLYAPWGKNFVLTMAKLTSDRDELTVVNDQRGRPTSCRHLARTSLALFDQGKRGFWHVTDGGECTWFELACHVRDVLGNTCDIQPCSSDAFPRPAKRPAYSVLDISETEAAVGSMPNWENNVHAVLGAQ